MRPKLKIMVLSNTDVSRLRLKIFSQLASGGTCQGNESDECRGSLPLDRSVFRCSIHPVNSFCRPFRKRFGLSPTTFTVTFFAAPTKRDEFGDLVQHICLKRFGRKTSRRRVSLRLAKSPGVSERPLLRGSTELIVDDVLRRCRNHASPPKTALTLRDQPMPRRHRSRHPTSMMDGPPDAQKSVSRKAELIRKDANKTGLSNQPFT